LGIQILKVIDMVTTSLGSASLSTSGSRMVTLEITGLANQKLTRFGTYKMTTSYSRLSQTLKGVHRLGGKVAKVTVFDPDTIALAPAVSSTVSPTVSPTVFPTETSRPAPAPDSPKTAVSQAVPKSPAKPTVSASTSTHRSAKPKRKSKR
jgi:hypothetical protein